MATAKKSTKKAKLTLAAVRRKIKKSSLGWREKTALNAKGAKLTKHRDYKYGYKITGGGQSFAFTYGDPRNPDFFIYG